MFLLKAKFIIIVAVSLLIGLVGGFFGGYYTYRIYPEKHAAAVAQKEQAELNKMVRHGDIVSIGADTVVVKVGKGAADVGKTLALRLNSGATVQVGSAVMNHQGAETDLTKWYKVGDTVDVMTRDGASLVAIYRPLRAGEQVTQVVQQTQPPAASAPQSK